MATRSYFPVKLAELMAWASNFNQIVGSSFASLGLTSVQQQALMSANTQMQALYTQAANPITRTRGLIAARNDATKSFKQITRRLVAIIQAQENVTDQQRIDLGITVRKTTPSKSEGPKEAPSLKTAKTDGRNVTVRIERLDGKRGRPANAVGTNLYYSTGENPSFGDGSWQPLLQTGKNIVEIPFGFSPTGGSVWIIGNYYSGAKIQGPWSTAIRVDLPAGGSVPKYLAEETEETIKIAA